MTKQFEMQMVCIETNIAVLEMEIEEIKKRDPLYFHEKIINTERINLLMTRIERWETLKESIKHG